ncbi:toprim domain-containing protein [Mucilaginibacter gynuensis]
MLTAKELKEQASIVELLAKLGYHPVPRHGRERMYISMLRDNDTTPSLSVNDDLGVWFDHGTRKGGNIIDFGLAYWKNLSFAEVVKNIQEVLVIQASEPRILRPRKSVRPPHYIIQEIKDIGTHPAITGYLQSRGILDEAKAYLSEVYYYVENKAGERKLFFAAGWPNDFNGWEVRNKYFKGCLGNKAISFIPGNEKSVAVFEGFLDFLSWKKEYPEHDNSVIVLNSITMLPEAVERAKKFSSIDLYFDRDSAGFGVTKAFCLSLPYATDRSSLYTGYKDYNDMVKAHMTFSKLAANYFSGTRVPFKR